HGSEVRVQANAQRAAAARRLGGGRPAWRAVRRRLGAATAAGGPGERGARGQRTLQEIPSARHTLPLIFRSSRRCAPRSRCARLTPMVPAVRPAVKPMGTLTPSNVLLPYPSDLLHADLPRGR